MPLSAEKKREKRAAKKAAAAASGEAAFRINRKNVGLTYSCPTNAEENPICSRERIRDVLVDKYGQALWTVSVELHESGQKHYHANFKFDNIVNSEDALCMDVDGVHPNILNPGKGWENYVRKQGEFITNKGSCDFAVALGKDTVHEALEHLWEHKPADMLKFGEAIERNVRKRMNKQPEYQPYYGPYQEWVDWPEDTHSLLIWGKPGSGKTQFARWLMAHKYGNYTYVKKSHEKLKAVTFVEDGKVVPFLFDEVYMLEHKEAEASREITDVENGGSVACRNTDAEIPPGVPRVFLSNYEHPFRNPKEAVYGRRVISLQYDHGFVEPEAEPERTRIERSRSPRRGKALAKYDPTGVLNGVL